MFRFFLVLAGIVSLALGILGIVLPLLPTTPFVLLSAYCFARSSQRLHQWLLCHPWFGKLLTYWEKHRGIQASHKRRAIGFTVFSFMVSIYLAPVTELRFLLVFIAVCVLIGISRITVITEA
ncbi:Inner membrane protein YbaN [invertebrate metagenome]|uniref:Inner membrane protein YbaN n=1 Tax=invertebrate metagenome TaxID=1711999 RepID=A0A2H9T7K7_9ZZZZ